MTEEKAEGDGRRWKLRHDHGWPLHIPPGLAFLKLEAAFIDAALNRFGFFHTILFRGSLTDRSFERHGHKVGKKDIGRAMNKLLIRLCTLVRSTYF